MRLLSTLLLLATAASSMEQPRWAVGISLRDADTSSLWRIGPRFAWGLTLGTNTFTHVADWRTWALDMDVRLTAKVFHHRAKKTAWFTFLEPRLVLYEVDYPYSTRWMIDEVQNEKGAISTSDRAANGIAAGTGIAWYPHRRLGCFIRWGVLFQYREQLGVGLPNQSWVELEKIRLTGLWRL